MKFNDAEAPDAVVLWNGAAAPADGMPGTVFEGVQFPVYDIAFVF